MDSDIPLFPDTWRAKYVRFSLFQISFARLILRSISPSFNICKALNFSAVMAFYFYHLMEVQVEVLEALRTRSFPENLTA
jgi:hypothetical protein